MKKSVMVGIGELLWDILPSGKRAGGAPANFAYHATQNGAEGVLISAVGKDENGKELLSLLEKNHISHLVSQNERPTGTVEVELENGIPTYRIVENVAWDFIENSTEAQALVKKADAVCFGTLALRAPQSRESILSLIDAASQNAFKVFDINLRENFYSLDLIETLLQKCNILKINDIEMAMISQLFNFKGNEYQICEYLLQKYNLQYLILTVGEKYSTVFSPHDCSLINTPNVEVADTIAAGDSFTATFIQGILEGKTQLQAHKNAVATAAFVCTKSGAWPKYDRKKIEEIKNGI